MANYATLKAAIEAVIYENGNQEITGEVLQATLLAMVNALGANYQYAGVATPSTNPGTPDQRVFYLANESGTYANFGGIVLNDGEVAILKYNGTWIKDATNLANIRRVEQLEQEIQDGFNVSIFEYSQFTTQTGAANIVVENDPFYMRQAGDYIEFKAKAKGDNGYILRRPTTNNQPCMRWYGEHTLQIRFNSATQWTYQNNAVDWNKAQVLKVVLDSVVDTTFNYKIYLDGMQVGTQAVTNGTSWTQIGYGYDGDLYYIKAKVNGGDEVVFTEFSKMTGAVGVTDVYSTEGYDGLVALNNRVDALEPKVTALEHAVTGEDMYFAFKKASTLYNITSHFGIYQRLKGNVYILTVIGYYTYSGAAGYPNGYWRVERTEIGTLEDGVFTLIQSQAITAGENEFVLQWLDGSGYNFSGGFSGGFHYGETIENVVGAWVEFVADGNRLSTDADIPLTPCKSFYYREYSPIYQHNDDSIAAWHLKETVFKDGGYETINDVKFVQALDYFAYPGIVCVSRWLSEKAMPEGVATITDMGDGSTTIAEQFKSNGHRIHYEGNGYMCDVESEVLIGANDSLCECVVYNSSAYNKYYRRNPDTDGSTANRLKGRCKVKIAAI